LARRPTLERVKPAGKAYFRVADFKFGSVADTGNFGTANDNRVIDRIREDRVRPTGWKDIGSYNCVCWIFRTCECEQVGEIGRRIADLSGPIDMIAELTSCD